MPQTISIAGKVIGFGERVEIELPLPALYDRTELGIPIEVIRGSEDGPVLLITSTIHGDELNGLAAIQRLLRSKVLADLKGTIIAVPIINIYGFVNKTRYLPDRRDLNRCFPGSATGSLGGRIANMLLNEVVSKATHVIDLHTGAINRTNLPQIRASMEDTETKKLAKIFGVPVLVDSNTRDGSFRQSVFEMGKPFLLFEGGQALRFEKGIINTILDGIGSVMFHLGMLPKKHKKLYLNHPSVVAKKSFWVRAPRSGIFKMKKKLGTVVKEGDKLATITDPLGKNTVDVLAPYSGIIIGMNLIPQVLAGEALFNIGVFKNVEILEDIIEFFDFELPMS